MALKVEATKKNEPPKKVADPAEEAAKVARFEAEKRAAEQRAQAEQQRKQAQPNDAAAQAPGAQQQQPQQAAQAEATTRDGVGAALAQQRQAKPPAAGNASNLATNINNTEPRGLATVKPAVDAARQAAASPANAVPQRATTAERRAAATQVNSAAVAEHRAGERATNPARQAVTAPTTKAQPDRVVETSFRPVSFNRPLNGAQGPQAVDPQGQAVRAQRASQIQTALTAGQSIDQIGQRRVGQALAAGDLAGAASGAGQDQVIADLRADGQTVEITPPTSENGDVQTTAITDPRTGRTVTEYYDYQHDSYHTTVTEPGQAPTSSLLRDGLGRRESTSYNPATRAVTTRTEADLGDGTVVERTRLPGGTNVQQTTAAGNPTETVVTSPDGRQTTLDPSQDPTGSVVTAVKDGRGVLRTREPNSDNGGVAATEVVDENGNVVAAYYNDYQHGGNTSLATDAGGQQTTLTDYGNGSTGRTVLNPGTGESTSHFVNPNAGTTIQTVIDGDGRRTQTTDVEGVGRTVNTAANGFTLTTAPDGGQTLRTNGGGPEVAIRPGSKEAGLAEALIAANPNSRDPEVARRDQAVTAATTALLFSREDPSAPDPAVEGATAVRTQAEERHTERHTGEKPRGNAPSGGDWVQSRGEWVDPEVARARAAEDSAVARSLEGVTTVNQAAAQFDVYAHDPAYEGAVEDAEDVINRALAPHDLVWTPTAPEGTLPEAQQRLADANHGLEQASGARAAYEAAQSLLDQAITAQAELPPPVHIATPDQPVMGPPGSYNEEAAMAANRRRTAAEAAANALFAQSGLQTATGDNSLAQFGVDVSQQRLDAAEPGTPEHDQAQAALDEASTSQQNAAAALDMARATESYHVANRELTRLQAQGGDIAAQIAAEHRRDNPGLYDLDRSYSTNGGDHLGNITSQNVVEDPADHQLYLETTYEDSDGPQRIQLTFAPEDNNVRPEFRDGPLNAQWQNIVNGAPGQTGLTGAAGVELSARIGLIDAQVRQYDSAAGTLDAEIARLTGERDRVQGPGLPVSAELQVQLDANLDQRAALDEARREAVTARAAYSAAVSQPIKLLNDAGSAAYQAGLQSVTATNLDQAIADVDSRLTEVRGRNDDHGWFREGWDAVTGGGAGDDFVHYLEGKREELISLDARDEGLTDEQYAQEYLGIMGDYAAQFQQRVDNLADSDETWQTVGEVGRTAAAAAVGIVATAATGGNVVAGFGAALGTYELIDGVSDASAALQGEDIYADGHASITAGLVDLAGANGGLGMSDQNLNTWTSDFTTDFISSLSIGGSTSAAIGAARAVSTRLGATGWGAAHTTLTNVASTAVGSTAAQAVNGPANVAIDAARLNADGQLYTQEGGAVIVNAIRREGVYLATSPVTGAVAGAIPIYRPLSQGTANAGQNVSRAAAAEAATANTAFRLNYPGLAGQFANDIGSNFGSAYLVDGSISKHDAIAAVGGALPGVLQNVATRPDTQARIEGFRQGDRNVDPAEQPVVWAHESPDGSVQFSRVGADGRVSGDLDGIFANGERPPRITILHTGLGENGERVARGRIDMDLNNDGTYRRTVIGSDGRVSAAEEGGRVPPTAARQEPTRYAPQDTDGVYSVTDLGIPTENGYSRSGDEVQPRQAAITRPRPALTSGPATGAPVGPATLRLSSDVGVRSARALVQQAENQLRRQFGPALDALSTRPTARDLSAGGIDDHPFRALGGPRTPSSNRGVQLGTVASQGGFLPNGEGLVVRGVRSSPFQRPDVITDTGERLTPVELLLRTDRLARESGLSWSDRAYTVLELDRGPIVGEERSRPHPDLLGRPTTFEQTFANISGKPVIYSKGRPDAPFDADHWAIVMPQAEAPLNMRPRYKGEALHQFSVLEQGLPQRTRSPRQELGPVLEVGEDSITLAAGRNYQVEIMRPAQADANDLAQTRAEQLRARGVTADTITVFGEPAALMPRQSRFLSAGPVSRRADLNYLGEDVVTVGGRTVDGSAVELGVSPDAFLVVARKDDFPNIDRLVGDITSHPNYRPGQDVVLFVCEAGTPQPGSPRSTSLANEASDRLGARVHAIDGDINVGERIVVDGTPVRASPGLPLTDVSSGRSQPQANHDAQLRFWLQKGGRGAPITAPFGDAARAQGASVNGQPIDPLHLSTPQRPASGDDHLAQLRRRDSSLGAYDQVLVSRYDKRVAKMAKKTPSTMELFHSFFGATAPEPMPSNFAREMVETIRQLRTLLSIGHDVHAHPAGYDARLGSKLIELVHKVGTYSEVIVGGIPQGCGVGHYSNINSPALDYAGARLLDARNIQELRELRNQYRDWTRAMRQVARVNPQLAADIDRAAFLGHEKELRQLISNLSPSEAAVRDKINSLTPPRVEGKSNEPWPHLALNAHLNITGFDPADAKSGEYVLRQNVNHYHDIAGVGETTLQKEAVTQQLSFTAQNFDFANPSHLASAVRWLSIQEAFGKITLIHSDWGTAETPGGWLVKTTNHGYDKFDALIDLIAPFAQNADSGVILAHAGGGRFVNYDTTPLPVPGWLANAGYGSTIPHHVLKMEEARQRAPGVKFDLSWNDNGIQIATDAPFREALIHFIERHPDAALPGTDTVKPVNRSQYLQNEVTLANFAAELGAVNPQLAKNFKRTNTEVMLDRAYAKTLDDAGVRSIETQLNDYATALTSSPQNAAWQALWSRVGAQELSSAASDIQGYANNLPGMARKARLGSIVGRGEVDLLESGLSVPGPGGTPVQIVMGRNQMRAEASALFSNIDFQAIAGVLAHLRQSLPAQQGQPSTQPATPFDTSANLPGKTRDLTSPQVGTGAGAPWKERGPARRGLAADATITVAGAVAGTIPFAGPLASLARAGLFFRGLNSQEVYRRAWESIFEDGRGGAVNVFAHQVVQVGRQIGIPQNRLADFVDAVTRMDVDADFVYKQTANWKTPGGNSQDTDPLAYHAMMAVLGIGQIRGDAALGTQASSLLDLDPRTPKGRRHNTAIASTAAATTTGAASTTLATMAALPPGAPQIVAGAVGGAVTTVLGATQGIMILQKLWANRAGRQNVNPQLSARFNNLQRRLLVGIEASGMGGAANAVTLAVLGSGNLGLTIANVVLDLGVTATAERARRIEAARVQLEGARDPKTSAKAVESLLLALGLESGANAIATANHATLDKWVDTLERGLDQLGW